MQAITVNDFESSVINQPYAVVDYWAEWCSNCMVNMPVVESVAATSPVPFVSVNIDQEPELKQKAGIKAIPALLFYRNGKMVDFLFGQTTQEKIQQKIEKLIG